MTLSSNSQRLPLQLSFIFSPVKNVSCFCSEPFKYQIQCHWFANEIERPRQLSNKIKQQEINDMLTIWHVQKFTGLSIDCNFMFNRQHNLVSQFTCENCTKQFISIDTTNPTIFHTCDFMYSIWSNNMGISSSRQLDTANQMFVSFFLLLLLLKSTLFLYFNVK